MLNFGLNLGRVIPGGPPSAGLIAYFKDGVDSVGLSTATVQPGRGYTGDGAAYITITGLLTTDTIISDSTDTPTCTTNGRLDIANTDVVYGVAIERTGVRLGYYPCAEGSSLVAYNIFQSDSALPDGVISDEAIHTDILDGSGYDLNQLGFSGRQNLLKSSNPSNGEWIFGASANEIEIEDGVWQVDLVDSYAAYPNSNARTELVFSTGDTVYHRIMLKALPGQSGLILIGDYTGNSDLYDEAAVTDEWSTFIHESPLRTGLTNVNVAISIRQVAWQTLDTVQFKQAQIALSSDVEFVETTGVAVRGIQPAQKDSGVRIGVLTDTHYSADGNGGSGHSTNIPAIISGLESANISAILGLGDMYHGDDWGSTLEMETDVDTFEAWFSGVTSPIVFATGNHDLGLSQAILDYSQYSIKNYSFDVGQYKFIVFGNSDSPYFSATPDTLTWLAAELEASRLAGKKIVVATHARIDQDYPGDLILFTTGPSEAGTITPAATTGDGITVTADGSYFSIDDVGGHLFIKQGLVWGHAIIASYVSPTEITVDITNDFDSTAASDEWGFNGYSWFSYNANAIRTIINSAVDSGANIIAVLQGHAHSLDINYNVDSKGVNYLTFPSASSAAVSYILDISGDGYMSIATGDYTVQVGGNDTLDNSLQYPGRIKYNLDVVSGTGASDWVVKLPAAPELIAALGLDNIYYSALGEPLGITYTDLMALEGAQVWGSEERQEVAIYLTDLTGNDLTRAQRYFNATP